MKLFYLTDVGHRLKAKRRRDERKAAGTCINAIAHGPATHGVLCERCRIAHRAKGRN